METIQLLTKNNRQVIADNAIYTGDFIILQTKKVKEDKVFITSEPFNLEQIVSITRVIDAESRNFPEPKPTLLVEQPKMILDTEATC